MSDLGELVFIAFAVFLMLLMVALIIVPWGLGVYQLLTLWGMQ